MQAQIQARGVCLTADEPVTCPASSVFVFPGAMLTDAMLTGPPVTGVLVTGALVTSGASCSVSIHVSESARR